MKRGLFSAKIVEWYEDHHRQLPWRETPDPYRIWLSEIILQQTRVIQGLPYYEKFVARYPSVKALAEAPEKEVLRLWQGLGYYTRARNLHRCAIEVTRKFNGRFPSTVPELKALPGIGDYTAAAIASMAFGKSAAVVDGNVYRVLARVFGIDKNIASPDGRKHFLNLANSIISKDNPGIHNQAVMEFGATHCLPRNPLCDDCIFKRSCFAYRRQQQDLYPVKILNRKIRNRYLYYLVLQHDDTIALKERTEKDIWHGLYDFPLVEKLKATSAQYVLKEYGLHSNGDALISKSYRHVLTHQVIHARFIHLRIPKNKVLKKLVMKTRHYYSPRQIAELPKPVLISRYLEDAGIL